MARIILTTGTNSPIDANDNRLINVADPTGATDGATMQYVDSGDITKYAEGQNISSGDQRVNGNILYVANKDITSTPETFDTADWDVVGAAADTTNEYYVVDGNSYTFPGTINSGAIIRFRQRYTEGGQDIPANAMFIYATNDPDQDPLNWSNTTVFNAENAFFRIDRNNVAAANDATITLAGGTGIQDIGDFSTNQGADETFTINVDIPDIIGSGTEFPSSPNTNQLFDLTAQYTDTTPDPDVTYDAGLYIYDGTNWNDIYTSDHSIDIETLDDINNVHINTGVNDGDLIHRQGTGWTSLPSSTLLQPIEDEIASLRNALRGSSEDFTIRGVAAEGVITWDNDREVNPDEPDTFKTQQWGNTGDDTPAWNMQFVRDIRLSDGGLGQSGTLQSATGGSIHTNYQLNDRPMGFNGANVTNSRHPVPLVGEDGQSRYFAFPGDTFSYQRRRADRRYVTDNRHVATTGINIGTGDDGVLDNGTNNDGTFNLSSSAFGYTRTVVSKGNPYIPDVEAEQFRYRENVGLGPIIERFYQHCFTHSDVDDLPLVRQSVTGTAPASGISSTERIGDLVRYEDGRTGDPVSFIFARRGEANTADPQWPTFDVNSNVLLNENGFTTERGNSNWIAVAYRPITSTVGSTHTFGPWRFISKEETINDFLPGASGIATKKVFDTDGTTVLDYGNTYASFGGAEVTIQKDGVDTRLFFELENRDSVDPFDPAANRRWRHIHGPLPDRQIFLGDDDRVDVRFFELLPDPIYLNGTGTTRAISDIRLYGDEITLNRIVREVEDVNNRATFTFNVDDYTASQGATTEFVPHAATSIVNFQNQAANDIVRDATTNAAVQSDVTGDYITIEFGNEVNDDIIRDIRPAFYDSTGAALDLSLDEGISDTNGIYTGSSPIEVSQGTISIRDGNNLTRHRFHGLRNSANPTGTITQALTEYARLWNNASSTVNTAYNYSLFLGDTIHLEHDDNGESVFILKSAGNFNRESTSALTTLTAGAFTQIDVTDVGESNVDAFGTIAVSGQTSVAADAHGDTLTLVAGTNVSITTDATNDSITINATDTDTNTDALADLTDTTISSPTDNQFLRYDGTAWVNETVTLGGAADDAFQTIAVSGQDNVVADTATDTLTLVGGTNVTITTDASTDTITFAATDTNTDTLAGLTDTSISSPTDNQFLRHDGTNWVNETVTLGGAAENTFSTIAITGTASQANVVADVPEDTLTLNAGSNISITSTAGTDTISIAADNTNLTIATPSDGDTTLTLESSTGQNVTLPAPITTSGSQAPGLISGADKDKLDGIADNATNTAAPAITAVAGAPDLATGITAEEIRTLIGVSASTNPHHAAFSFNSPSTYTRTMSTSQIEVTGVRPIESTDNNTFDYSLGAATSTSAGLTVAIAPGGIAFDSTNRQTYTVTIAANTAAGNYSFTAPCTVRPAGTDSSQNHTANITYNFRIEAAAPTVPQFTFGVINNLSAAPTSATDISGLTSTVDLADGNRMSFSPGTNTAGTNGYAIMSIPTADISSTDFTENSAMWVFTNRAGAEQDFLRNGTDSYISGSNTVLFFQITSVERLTITDIS